MTTPESPIYDYVIIGSGFGGSVSAMRLAEKGYSVLVLERGKRYEDGEFPKTNWNIWKFLWLPALRCFGIMQFSFFRNILALHGDGVGGGSLVLVPVFYDPDVEVAKNIIKACANGGAECIEMTNRGDSAIEVFRALEDFCCKKCPL